MVNEENRERVRSLYQFKKAREYCCEQCGVTFSNTNKSKFCTNKCKQKSRYAKRVGK